LDEQDHDLLTYLREILLRHKKAGRFGLRLLHDPLGLGERVLLETCDPTSRILTCRTTIEDDPEFADAIPHPVPVERRMVSRQPDGCSGLHAILQERPEMLHLA
jgi:hypothetical protein